MRSYHWIIRDAKPFKCISYLELWQPFCSAERNHLCNFGREYQEEQFCEIYLNLGQWFRSRCLKRFLIWSSGNPPVQWRGTIYAVLKEGMMGNIHVKLYKIRTSGSGDVVLRKIYTRTDDKGRPITIPHLEPWAQVS